jgi:hypothetical protein
MYLIVEEPGEPFWMKNFYPFPDEQSGTFSQTIGDTPFSRNSLKLKIGSQIYIATPFGATEGYQKISNTLTVTRETTLAPLESALVVEPLMTPDGTSQPVTATTPVKRGHKLEYNIYNTTIPRWVPVTVTDVLPDGKVETLRPGGTSHRKEIVTRNKLRIPAQMP